MKTTVSQIPARRLALAGLLAASLIPGLAQPAKKAKDPVYENYIDISAGYNLQSGHRPAYQKRLQLEKDGYGGIEDLRYTREINDDTSLRILGRMIAGNADYLLDLTLTKEEVGYLKLGYKQFRVWYDGAALVWPTNGFRLQLFDEDMHIDRGNLWFEAGYTKPDAINFVLGYEMQTRKGMKESLAWQDTGLAISPSLTRNISPSFWKIDETRHIFRGSASKSSEKAAWELGARFDQGEYTNGRYGRRRPFEPAFDRSVTAKEGQDFDLTQYRGSYIANVNEQITLTTAVARTTIDTVLSGSRINGMTYDAEYTNNYPTRQQRDEGFFVAPGHSNLGESEMTQTVATLSALYSPTENVRVVPGFRFEKTEWDSMVVFEESNFGAAPLVAPILEEVEAASDKAWKTYSASLDVRYTGMKNLALNFNADWSNSEGELREERILEPGTTHAVISIDRDTDLERSTQKYAVSANWYPRAGTTVAVQYYFKARQNDYRAIRDNTVSSADRYPAYVTNQDFETNDFNVRLSWRLSPNFRTVTRYDYQQTTIHSQEVGLSFQQSMKSTSHILSESITWSPLARWYIQGNVNLVWDTLTTPAVNVTGAALNLVKNSDANYTTFGLSSGYALDDQSDLLVDYSFFESRGNWINNSAQGVPYGSDSEFQMASVGWSRKMSPRTTVTLRYSHVKNDDVPSLGRYSYDANMLYGKVQYRF
jgi:hypothetical protein